MQIPGHGNRNNNLVHHNRHGNHIETAAWIMDILKYHSLWSYFNNKYIELTKTCVPKSVKYLLLFLPFSLLYLKSPYKTCFSNNVPHSFIHSNVWMETCYYPAFLLLLSSFLLIPKMNFLLPVSTYTTQFQDIILSLYHSIS